MSKFFNTSGLCVAEKHYMVDPLDRISCVENFIEKELYFAIHAPRQTGKTTYLHALAKKLNTAGKYIALVASLERGGYRGITHETAFVKIMHSIYKAGYYQLPENERPAQPDKKKYLDLYDYITEWCEDQSKPVVLLLDEIDSLMDDVLISVLRQLRDGYQIRPDAFPSSIALVGLRDVRDYRMQIRSGDESLGTGSPFNIKEESILLTNFSEIEVSQLLKQHTQETSQAFPDAVIQEIYRLTNGQPWLVNALAKQIVSGILKDDYTFKISVDLVTQAKKHLIRRRDTHLDSLGEILKHDRVKKIVQAILKGDVMNQDVVNDDICYIRDMGLVAGSPLKFANPIYAEIIPRMMADPIELSISEDIQTPWFLSPDKKLDMQKVLTEFQKFYRRNSEMWIDRWMYKEAAHHLVLMAFLQRIINAGGEIVREMALGNQRLDILVRYKDQEFALELKINRGEYCINEGKEQLSRYLDKVGLKYGYLILFETKDIPWEEKIYTKEIHYEGKTIMMVGV